MHKNQATSLSTHALIFAGLIGLNVAMRLVTHAPNCTPMLASALFAGFFLPRLLPAFLAPMIAVTISDRILGGYDWRVMASVYAALALPVLLRGVLRSRLSPLRVLAAALGSSVVFFLTTNFAVWRFSGMYELNASGLAHCYAAALPFLKYALSGDLLWSGLLFGGYALLTSERFALLRPRAEQAASA